MSPIAKRGILESVYTFAGNAHDCSITNAETPEGLNDLMMGTPAFSLCDVDVYPLADFYKQMERSGFFNAPEATCLNRPSILPVGEFHDSDRLLQLWRHR
jgi:muconolactone delta-isomerase